MFLFYQVEVIYHHLVVDLLVGLGQFYYQISHSDVYWNDNI